MSNPFKDSGLRAPALFFVLTVLLRLPFRSRMLFSWDSVQLALGTEHYDITVHQPHPPGYFLYVMAGKLLNLITGDPNVSFVALSVVASGLSVATLYMLAERMYGGRTALYSALIALTSPLYWLYGGVAATYAPEAFFGTLAAYLSWNILKGSHRHVWALAVVLAVAGGVRQSTVVFLAPMVLYAIRRVPMRRLALPVVIFAALTAAWFVPMTVMTGGYDKYRAAVDELWRFGVGPVSVMNAGLENVPMHMKSLGLFAWHGLGFSMLFVAGFIVLRFGAAMKGILSERGLFLALWTAAPAAFFVMIAVNPDNPGVALLYTPALILVSARALEGLAERFTLSRRIAAAALAAVMALNAYSFALAGGAVSYGMLRQQRQYLDAFIKAVRRDFRPEETVITSTMYLYAGARHFMYYLPEYRVYVMDETRDEEGTARDVFWGHKRRTYTSEAARIAAEVKYFINPLVDEKFAQRVRRTVGVDRVGVLKDAHGGNLAVYGDVRLAPEIYHGVRFFFEGQSANH